VPLGYFMSFGVDLLTIVVFSLGIYKMPGSQ
jgi:hypothetical protein